MVIRWLRRGDLSAIVQIVQRELIPLSPHPHPRGRKLRQEIKTRLQQGSTLVAETDGRTAAFLHLIIQQRVLFVDLLAVDRAYQGAGLGARLMKRAERQALEQNCAAARLYVDEENEGGRRFYERLGYGIVAYHASLQCYEMAKRLLG